MSNPYETPETSDHLREEEKLRQYWYLIRNRRNAFYLYFFLAGPALNALTWGIVVYAEMPPAIDAISVGVSIVYFAGLFWFGYRLTNIRCFQCQYKLSMGHFFFMKNVRCLGCGFRLPTPDMHIQPDSAKPHR